MLDPWSTLLESSDSVTIYALSSWYACMVNTIYLFSFVETPRRFIIANLSIRKLESSSCSANIISTDEDPSSRIESFAIINLRGVSTKLNKYIYALFLPKLFRSGLSEHIRPDLAKIFTRSGHTFQWPVGHLDLSWPGLSLIWMLQVESRSILILTGDEKTKTQESSEIRKNCKILHYIIISFNFGIASMWRMCDGFAPGEVSKIISCGALTNPHMGQWSPNQRLICILQREGFVTLFNCFHKFTFFKSIPFTCRIQSKETPLVKWVKRIDYIVYCIIIWSWHQQNWLQLTSPLFIFPAEFIIRLKSCQVFLCPLPFARERLGGSVSQHVSCVPNLSLPIVYHINNNFYYRLCGH